MPPRKILLVDDEQYVTTLVATKLRILGDEVMTACDGEEALRVVGEFLPDLVVSDFQMPCMSGSDFALALRSNPPTAHIPVIMLTARGHLLSPGELAQTNVRQKLAKPFSVKELILQIGKLIGPPRVQSKNADSGRAIAG